MTFQLSVWIGPAPTRDPSACIPRWTDSVQPRAPGQTSNTELAFPSRPRSRITCPGVSWLRDPQGANEERLATRASAITSVDQGARRSAVVDRLRATGKDLKVDVTANGNRVDPKPASFRHPDSDNVDRILFYVKCNPSVVSTPRGTATGIPTPGAARSIPSFAFEKSAAASVGSRAATVRTCGSLLDTRRCPRPETHHPRPIRRSGGSAGDGGSVTPVRGPTGGRCVQRLRRPVQGQATPRT